MEDDDKVHTITKGIRLQVNVIARLEFELTHYNVTVSHNSHYTTRTPLEKDVKL